MNTLEQGAVVEVDAEGIEDIIVDDIKDEVQVAEGPTYLYHASRLLSHDQ